MPSTIKQDWLPSKLLGKSGRRQHYFTLEQEYVFLQPFLERAARGEIATAIEIRQAYEKAKKPVASSTCAGYLAHPFKNLEFSAV